jgi:hypothetical protein
MKFKTAATLLTAVLLTATYAIPASAHHSVLHYDGKRTVTITGIVTKARFGYPHSIYRIEVTDPDGSKEEWVLSTEDPRDAKRLGFDEEIKNLKPGDEITVVGWPHQYIERELRGHQLRYPDGRVVMMRTGNYIWPRDLLRLDKFVMNPQNIPQYVWKRTIQPNFPASINCCPVTRPETISRCRSRWSSSTTTPERSSKIMANMFRNTTAYFHAGGSRNARAVIRSIGNEQTDFRIYHR